MPTRPPAALKHKSFNWGKSLEILEKALRPRLEELLRFSGFLAEYGIETLIEFGSRTVIDEANAHFDELIGILLKAAAIRIDAGFKPKGQVISTLKAIAKNPRLMMTSARIEPEAVGVLAANYQRNGEQPGTHCYDVLDPGIEGTQPLKAENVKQAALSGIELLKKNSKNEKERNFGRGTLSLAIDLRRWISALGNRPTRIAFPYLHGDSITVSSMDQLIDIVLPSLNQLVEERGARAYSASTLVKEICART